MTDLLYQLHMWLYKALLQVYNTLYCLIVSAVFCLPTLQVKTAPQDFTMHLRLTLMYCSRLNNKTGTFGNQKLLKTAVTVTHNRSFASSRSTVFTKV